MYTFPEASFWAKFYVGAGERTIRGAGSTQHLLTHSRRGVDPGLNTHYLDTGLWLWKEKAVRVAQVLVPRN